MLEFRGVGGREGGSVQGDGVLGISGDERRTEQILTDWNSAGLASGGRGRCRGQQIHRVPDPGRLASSSSWAIDPPQGGDVLPGRRGGGVL